MASRKSSRTTTQRRRDLLRSVVEFHPGRRMATNGLFRLGSQTMTEVNKTSGRSRAGSYFLVRNNLADALRLAVSEPSAKNVIPTYYTGMTGITRFNVHVSGDTLSIGCKTFTGKDAAALKEWALAE